MKELERTLDQRAIAALRQDFTGAVIVPGDPDYDAARIVWNGMIDRRPAVVARCCTTSDVLSATRFARERDLLVAVRGGGHSVGGFSTCDDGIVIDLSSMRGVAVDPDGGRARANGGALLSELDAEAQRFGLACPVGVVGHTGVGGLTLGGGMGRLQRKHGFTIDNLVGVDLVTADGRLIHASEDENADLFWGMRGAGANFGVVASFEFQLHPIGPTVTQGIAVHPAERAHEVAGLFRDAMAAAPDELMLSLNVALAEPDGPWPPELIGHPLFIVGGTHCGSLQDAERDLKALRGLAPLMDTFGPKSYLQIQGMNDDAMAWGKRFYMKGGFLAALTDAAMDTFVDQVSKAPGQHCSISLWAQGGAISRVAPDAMAFTGREAACWLGVEALWEDPALDEAHFAWGRATMKALEPFTAKGHYVNDMVETGASVVRSIYGEAKYERLVSLKRAFDPDNVFRLNQNIVP